MTPFTFQRILAKTAALLIILALAAGCSPNNPSPPSAEPIDNVTNGPSLDRDLPPVMGVALDSSGVAIPLPRVGAGIGDFNGVISGDLDVSPAGWVTVDAFGYATTYSHIFAETNGSALFEARLTQFSAGTRLDEGASGKLTIQNDEDLSLNLTVHSMQFAAPDVWVMMAAINRLDVDAAHQDVDGGKDLNLHFAFALQAFNSDWHEVALQPGEQLEITLGLPVNLGDDVTLAVFDPISGMWESIPGACNLIKAATYQCNLSRLSPLVGIFNPARIVSGQTASPAEKPTITRTGSGAEMSPVRSRNDLDSSFDTQFKLAWDGIADWLNKNPEAALDDPALLDLLDQLIDAALKFAAGNRNEAGKLHLMKAGEAALWLGADQLGTPATSEAAHIAHEMGEEILKDPDCGKFQEANKIAENNMMLAGLPGSEVVDNAGIARAIWDTYENLIKDCDVWIGTVTLRLPILVVHPVDDFSRTSGSSEWWEMHQIQISTNVKTFASRAEDHVSLLFFPVNYTAPQFECPNEITYSSSQPGRLFLSTTGSFDGYEFTFGNLTPHIDSSPGTVAQAWNFQSKYGDPPSCQPDAGGQESFQFGFYSLLAHGFLGETPAITLQEMLDTWEVGSDVIQGSRGIENPEPDTGQIPVAGGSATWNLHHDQAKLPLPE